MIQYVVYNSPDDFPGRFVVRQWDVSANGLEPMESWDFETLDDARAHIPDGFVCINRHYSDELCIVETWI
ncbi:MAG: hypothetical protein JNJ45_05380 [Chthonomonas sp.]|nr:hypothetical protein [Chthonomonas sp.]